MSGLINIKEYPVREVLHILLRDKTTRENIIWATDAYSSNGSGFSDKSQITKDALLGMNAIDLQPRIEKTREEQQERTRKKAEVFTPVWLCNKMNNYCDERWFGWKDVFNKECSDHQWDVTDGRIKFPEDKDWKSYIDSRRLEITCGEAPYLVSRYDTVTGNLILPPIRRIGILDRKLRTVNENTDAEDEWLKWAYRAFQSCYGYEYQGDSLLIARFNLLMTFCDYYEERWKKQAEKKLLSKIANIISWNIWQMDGLKDTVPLGKPYEEFHQTTLFELFESQEEKEVKAALPCRIYNWRSERSVLFKDCKERYGMEKKLFDFVIGNPPYQEEAKNKGDRSNPVYHIFMEEAFSVSDTVELITPARFLFDAGQTPKAWNEKLLNDTHFQVLHYEADATVFFPTTEIKGGVAITIRDNNKNYGAIKVFTAFDQLNTIVKKVINVSDEFISSIASPRGNYRTTELFSNVFPSSVEKLGKGTGNMLVSNFFEKLPEVILDEEQITNETPYLKILCRINNARTFCKIKKEYIQNNSFIDYYNVVSPEANGSGKFGEKLTIGEVLLPQEGATDTFVSLGAFKTKEEAEHLQKYMKTKLFRALLGVKKVTQHCPPSVWQMIPLQDFTEASDIDWSKSIHEIDLQLYKKYGLDQEEIEFIETNVKEMV